MSETQQALKDRKKRTTAQEIWQYAGQVPAGALSILNNTLTEQEKQQRLAEDANDPWYKKDIPNLIATSLGYEPIEPYRSALPDQVPAMYGVIKSLLGGELEPDSLPAQSIQRVMTGVEDTNEMLGIENPENAAQMALNIGGSLVVPGPKVPAANAATKVGRFAQNTGRVAAEVALPMRQTGVGTIPLGAGIGTAMMEGVDALADNPEYNSLADQVRDTSLTPEQKEQVSNLAMSGATAEELFATIDGFGKAYGKTVEDYRPIAEFYADPKNRTVRPDFSDQTELAEPVEPTPDSLIDPETDLPVTPLADEGLSTTAKVALAGLTAFSSVALGTAAYNRFKNAATIDPTVGTRTIKTDASTKTKLKTAIINADEPIRAVVDEVGSPEAAKKVNHNLDLVLPQALGSKVVHQSTTGELPNSSIRTEPWAVILEASARELTPDEYITLQNGLLANTALDDIRRLGVQPSLNDKTPQQLQDDVTAMMSNPKTAKYADKVTTQYRDILRYLTEQGMFSAQDAIKLMRNAPNYVHMSRDVQRIGMLVEDGTTGYTGVNVTDDLFSRAEFEGGGVQVGAVANPMEQLPGRWASAIRMVELNRVKTQVIDTLLDPNAARQTITTSDGKTLPLIRPFGNVAPKNMEGVHAVYRNGKPYYYKINDPTLDTAMKFAPHATMPILGTMRQVASNLITGPANPGLFALIKSPFFDTLTAMTLRPNGRRLGVLDEAIGKWTNGKYTLGELDPTAFLSAITGGARAARWDITQKLANEMTVQLLSDNPLLKSVVVRDGITKIRDSWQAAYDASVRATMNAQGASSAVGFGRDVTQGLPVGVETVAPHFASMTDMQNFDKAIVAQNATALDKTKLVLSEMGSQVNKVLPFKSFAKLYMGLVRAVQDGTRYSYMAANKADIGRLPPNQRLDALNALASETRRVAIDMAQHGGNEAWSRVADSVMYLNATAQSNYQIASFARHNPVQFTRNTVGMASMLVAAYYASMAYDPDARERAAKMTPTQLASTLPLAYGIDFPIAPEQRMLIGPLIATLNELAKEDDGSFNPNFMSAINRYFDDSDPLKQEQVEYAGGKAFEAGRDATLLVNPWNPTATFSGVPAIGAAMGLYGADPALTRVTGELAAARPQSVDPLAGDGTKTDSFLTTTYEKAIQGAIGSAVTQWIAVADDFQRALGAERKDGKEVGLAQAFNVATSRAKDNLAGGPTVLGSLFGQYEKLQQSTNAGVGLMRDKEKGVDQITLIERKFRAPDETGTGRDALPLPTDTAIPDFAGTPMETIALVTKSLNKQIRKLDADIGPITKQIDAIKNGYKVTDIEDRNKAMNDLLDRRNYLYMHRLMAMHEAEEEIRAEIGDPTFTYQNFKPDKYLQPMQALPSE